VSGTKQPDQTNRVMPDRRRQEMALLGAWQDARTGLVAVVAKRDRLAERRERAVSAILGMTPAEVKWARHHARTGQYPTTVASRVNYAAYVHRCTRVEKAEAQWAERITAAQVAVDEAAATLCEATRALLSGTTAQTVEELTGLNRRQVAGLAQRASALRLSAC
jgi:hypothetical protein